MEHGLLPKEMSSAIITESLTSRDLKCKDTDFLLLRNPELGRGRVLQSFLKGGSSCCPALSSHHSGPGCHTTSAPLNPGRKALFVLLTVSLGIRRENIYRTPSAALPVLPLVRDWVIGMLPNESP